MSFGRPYILKIDGCIHDGWIAMSDYEKTVISGYLYEVLNSNFVQDYWKQKANNGGAMSNLNSDIVRETEIPVPTISEQARIVGVLDTFTSSIENLNLQIAERRKQYEWDYPTPQDISAQQRKLQIVRLYALGKIKTKLRSQHALLYMRCNMMLGQHKDNITFWEQTASQFINTVYKDMMKNIYAGALYKTGRTAEAGELFAEMDDYESLMTIYYKKRSYLAISQQYKQNPNAKVLPFLLQDFVNNAQEAQDAKGEGAIGGKLFIRDINQQESRPAIDALKKFQQAQRDFDKRSKNF